MYSYQPPPPLQGYPTPPYDPYGDSTPPFTVSSPEWPTRGHARHASMYPDERGSPYTSGAYHYSTNSPMRDSPRRPLHPNFGEHYATLNANVSSSRSRRNEARYRAYSPNRASYPIEDPDQEYRYSSKTPRIIHVVDVEPKGSYGWGSEKQQYRGRRRRTNEFYEQPQPSMYYEGHHEYVPRHSTPQPRRRGSVSQQRPSTATGRPSSSHHRRTHSSARKEVRQATNEYEGRPRAQATREDAKKYGIPASYSIKNWDPSEEPITVLGSVFDANSLGKWIYDWTCYRHHPDAPMADVAGDLWLMMISLTGYVRDCKEAMGNVRSRHNRQVLEEFIDSGYRLFDNLCDLIKLCEEPMLKTGKVGKQQLGPNAGVELVNHLFGRDKLLKSTEQFMANVRLWLMRFEANCRDIISTPQK